MDSDEQARRKFRAVIFAVTVIALLVLVAAVAVRGNGGDSQTDTPSCDAVPTSRPDPTSMGGASLTEITESSNCGLTVKPTAACTVQNTAADVEVKVNTTGFTLGQYDTFAWYPSGGEYNLSLEGPGTVGTDGSLSFTWLCEAQDQADPGPYVIVLKDRTTGNWVAFFIEVEAQPRTA